MRRTGQIGKLDWKVRRSGAELTYQIAVPVDGKYRLDFIYGNGTGSTRNNMQTHSHQNVTQIFFIDGAKDCETVMENPFRVGRLRMPYVRR